MLEYTRYSLINVIVQSLWIHCYIWFMVFHLFTPASNYNLEFAFDLAKSTPRFCFLPDEWSVDEIEEFESLVSKHGQDLTEIAKKVSERVMVRFLQSLVNKLSCIIINGGLADNLVNSDPNEVLDLGNSFL